MKVICNSLISIVIILSITASPLMADFLTPSPLRSRPVMTVMPSKQGPGRYLTHVDVECSILPERGRTLKYQLIVSDADGLKVNDFEASKICYDAHGELISMKKVDNTLRRMSEVTLAVTMGYQPVRVQWVARTDNETLA